jgi:hypothetical protein
MTSICERKQKLIIMSPAADGLLVGLLSEAGHIPSHGKGLAPAKGCSSGL